MTTEFSFPRIGLLLKSEIARNYKLYLSLLAVQLGIYLLGMLFGGINGMIGAKSILTTFSLAVIIFLPFMLYKHLFHTTKGVNATMLPASQSEKFAVSMFQCLILIPFLLLFFSWLLSVIGLALTGVNEVMMQPWHVFGNKTISINTDFNLGFFESRFWNVISMQAICIWGVYFFKTKKFWKTVLTFCCACIAIGIIGSIGIDAALKSYDGGVYTFLAEAGTRFARILSVFFNIIVPVGLWVWAYIAMRRQQF